MKHVSEYTKRNSAYQCAWKLNFTERKCWVLYLAIGAEQAQLQKWIMLTLIDGGFIYSNGSAVAYGFISTKKIIQF